MRAIFFLVFFMVSQQSIAMKSETDYSSVFKQLIETLQKQYLLVDNISSTNSEELEVLKALKRLNSESQGYGTLSNNASTLANWQTSSNWNDALKNISGGNETRYRELVTAYENAHPTLNDATLIHGTSTEHWAQFKQNHAVNKAVSVETTYVFNELNERIKNIHELSLVIDKTKSTKGAVDLNSRLIAELAFIEVLNLKLQTLVSQQLAQNSANELAEDSEMIRFNTLPDK